MKTILVLMDSLNRHMLNVYNEDTFVKTPNIEQFASDSVVFDNHFIGSMPCMPARRDIFTGRLNFLERNWGALEPYDITLQQMLKKNKICTHITTDHTHYVEMGGENYLQQFDTWDIHRGQENDQWISIVDAPALPKEYLGKVTIQYECNRTRFVTEQDYPTPRTFKSACEWADTNRGADNFFLMVEAFDPHEPFDSPNEFLELYNDDYNGPRFEWSTYDVVTESPEAIKHIRNKYAATLTMADKWFGKFIDSLKKNDLYEDTLIIFTADHGHILGEHGFTGKNFMHSYNEIANIPLLIHLPMHKHAKERRETLTQNIDLMPTILEHFNIECPDSIKGHSLTGVLEGKQQEVRDAAIFGWHGKTVNVTDGKYTYFRAAVREDNQPCYNYCVTPTSLRRYLGVDDKENIECGRFLPRAEYPQLKIKSNDRRGKYIFESLLFDIKEDYEQMEPIKNADIEKSMIEKMINCMKNTESPKEQYERLGLQDMV